MNRKKALRQEAAARQIAEQKLAGSRYVLSRGSPIHDVAGWRFPVRKIDDPDISADGQPMVVTILVRSDELAAD